MTLEQAFAALHTYFGTHTDAAAYLGLTKEHYSQLRNGRLPIPQRTAELIILKAEQATTLPASKEAVSV